MKRLALIVVGVAALASFNVHRAIAQPPRRRRAPTFAKDVAPIMFNKCANCHRPGEVAPMSLLSYEDVRPWAKAIKSKVVAREMPPWGADHAQTLKMRNDLSLSQSSRSTRSPRGSTAARRRATTPTCRRRRSSPTGWTYGTRARLRPRDAGRVRHSRRRRARRADVLLEGAVRPRIASPRSLELRPGNRAVVHHAGIFFVDIPEGATLVERPD